MSGNIPRQHSIESYITPGGTKGYFLLAQDEEGGWCWSPAGWEKPDLSLIAFRNPCSSRGEAIIAAEDWLTANGG